MFKTFERLYPFLYKHRFRYLLGIIWIFLADVMQMFMPKVLGKLIDDLGSGALSFRSLLYGLLVILGSALLTVLFRYLWRMYIFGTARTLEYDLRNMLFSHLLTLSPNWYNRRKVGDLMAHATNDIGAVRFAFGGGVVMFFDTLILVTMTLFVMITTINLKLTLIAIIPLPLIAIISHRFGGLIHHRFREAQEAFSRLSERVQENISGARVVRAFVQEEAEIEKFNEASHQVLEKNTRLIRVQSIFQPVIQLFVGLSMLIVLIVGGGMVLSNTITIGDFVAFTAYLGMLVWPMRAIGWVINILQRGAASMDRLNRLFEETPDICDGPDTDYSIRTLKGHIEIKALTFTYPGQNKAALKDINLSVPPGHTVGIIGKTGSGKTTLVSLLARLYEAPPGTIFIDGHPIHRIPLSVLRGAIGFVPQDHFLFSMSIYDNIAFGVEKASLQEVEQAARMASVHTSIMDFPDAYQTMVGERGVTLSGGQKQRISIARALLKKPAILILDDALSAVDAHTEAEILKNLKQSPTPRTTFIIAHRTSAVEHADEIIVLDEGHIVERGHHDTLLAQGGVYARMVEEQSLRGHLEAIL
ncbi:MAG: ABC transporter ATP-binding protein [Candidatus Carbobacillus altaicus]|uniref:Lipid A export ATP-binding/permease protein MsbA n=1 Tax=Candidatus Carbonibacillus altaicus TaxID=2163959 RepID=A0A2R6Y1M6_9BACL|nr:ABC transporter ATP-binding protein [Candidatus Carbobacillus altaicus]PTQ56542.1 MAG: Lipid A export ATP-binding/permease protein MsbA [Candidatus Carbobacillus altaicus]